MMASHASPARYKDGISCLNDMIMSYRKKPEVQAPYEDPTPIVVKTEKFLTKKDEKRKVRDKSKIFVLSSNLQIT
jgi:hypothetical protein